MSNKLKVLVTDDHLVVRKGIISLLREQKTLSLDFYEASNYEELLLKIKKEQIDIILLVITMPDLDGLVILKKLCRRALTPPIIMITMHNYDYIIRYSIKYDASGFILKNFKTKELVKAIKTVLNGNKYFDNINPNLLIKDDKLNTKIKRLYNKNELLTRREIEVISMYVKGYSNKKISNELNLNFRTVEGHRFKIMKKLNMNSFSQLLQYGIENEF
ncbi:MAG: response regulator [Crocinitomicaceae bacterium]|jgi:DNA-binding NarL/FixJ family response regulator